MKAHVISMAILLLTSTLAFSQKATDDFSGRWNTPKGIVITITKSGNTYTGIAEDKRVVLKGVKFSDGKWQGIIQKGEGGTQADCELVLNKNKLTIYATKYLFKKTLVWEKE